jgi:uncharacterized membrane protein
MESDEEKAAVPADVERSAVVDARLCLAILLVLAVPLFLGGLLSDIAYARTYQVQWLNFAAWLIAGAMVFTGLGLAWSLIELVLSPADRRRRALGVLILLAAFILGLLDSFMHARDAWGAMPAGLIQSLVVTALAAAAAWMSVSRLGAGAAR